MILGKYCTDRFVFLALKFKHCGSSPHPVLLRKLLLAARFGLMLMMLKRR